MVTIYGIRNCDKCRAAIKWFANQPFDSTFHDVRADGISATTVKRWQTAIGDDALMNKRSPTWRNIPDAEKTDLDSAGNRALMLAHPTLIKRPVVEYAGSIVVGYDEDEWSAQLNGSNP